MRRPHLRAQPGKSLSAPYRKELTRMNHKAFLAMVGRAAHVARRKFAAMSLQTFLQPLMFVFIFGRVMVGSGYMPPSYKSLLLPGIMAISMVGTGIWAVAMPLIAEFQWTREIEDRLLAPMRSEEHTSELQSRSDLVCRLLLEKKKKNNSDLSALHNTERATH